MKLNKTFIYAALVPAVSIIAGCDDTSNIGSSVTADQITVTVDSSFVVTGKSVEIGKVQSRTVSQLIGKIDAGGFGRLSSDVVTQFMPAAQIDTTNVSIDRIDSVVLRMGVVKGEFIGDSVAPLGIDVYLLDRQLPSPIYSDFDASDYYSPDNLIASTIYNVSANTAGANYSDGHTEIKVKLPLEFGKNLYRQYLDNPASFNTPTAFAKIFPGFYIKNSFGSGRLTRVTSTMMTLYYNYDYYNTTTESDTILVGSGNYFAVTPEIITNNNVSMTISPEVKNKINNGENIIMAPVGLEVKMRFPAPEILAAYRAENNPVKVLNTLTFSVPGEYIENDYSIPMPQYLLLVLEKDKDDFFAGNKLPDSTTSFYATYNSTTGLYSFGDMRAYIMDLLEKDTVSEEDYSFVITPVSAVFETVSSGYYSTTTQLSQMTPYMASPVMARLILDKAKVCLTFSSQTISK